MTRRFLLLPISLCLGLCLSLSFPLSGEFKLGQMKGSRVKTAFSEYYDKIKADLEKQGMDINKVQLLVRALKAEKVLQLWVRNGNKGKFELLKVMDICASSGDLGPKRRSGDGQVPEGFYTIDRFNPWSNFYLSLGVSYPNSCDRQATPKGNRGGDIFIHGSCVTIGCMPLTDEGIKYVYVLAVEARDHGQAAIPVLIFPCEMDEKGMKMLAKKNPDPGMQAFWKSLKSGYDFFNETYEAPTYKSDEKGNYIFAKVQTGK